MYKLVVIGGKLRGQEFVLEDGETIFGKSDECDIILTIDGISKKHMNITVTDDVAYIVDLDSSNGTFLNGKIIKRATAKNGDKITLPHLIMQVVYVEEKKILIHKVVSEEDEEEDEESFLDGGVAPDNLPGKILHLFKYKLMRIVHGINEEYEWRILFGIILTVFIITSVILIITPVLQSTKNILLYETAKRGAHYAEEIGRMNARALESKNLDQVNTEFLNQEDGVQTYQLFDLEGRIVRPLEKLNDYISEPLSVQVREWALKTSDDNGKKVYKKILSGDEIGIGKKIMAYNAKIGVFEAVGIIAIRFAPKSLAVEATKSQKAYLESIVTSMLVAIIFFGIVYYMTVRPLEELKFQIEDALRGRRRNLKSRYLMSELDGLRDSINSILQRNRELQNEEVDEFGEAESDEKYVSLLKEFMAGSGTATMVLNSEKNLKYINLEGEDLTGIRESAASDMSLLDVSREKGFGATCIELCDGSASNSGYLQEGRYELQGIDYKICVTALMGVDNFAKAFYITFIKD
ncbi:MAG: FHA domain-containing protein [Bacteriovoracaceae bacterium]|jgi:hypothetical protein|nr:FHA domain-containing protein [Bacteriovoracaceae bacterium]